MMGQGQAVCLVCSQKNSSLKLDKLRRIEQYVRTVSEPESGMLGLLWDVNERCRYGLTCPELSRRKTEANAIAARIEPYITKIIKTQDRQAFHRLLEMLRGDFPAVYRYLDREFNRENQKRQEEPENG